MLTNVYMCVGLQRAATIGFLRTSAAFRDEELEQANSNEISRDPFQPPKSPKLVE